MKALYFLLNVVQAVFLLAWSAFWISAALVVMVLTWNPSVPLAMARRFWAPGLLAGAFVKLRVEPLPDVDWRQPHIFVMNHQSMIDIPCAFRAIPANLRFVAKHSLKYVPFLGWYMWATGMLFVNRSDRATAIKSLSDAGARIRGGINILAFPEGTRSAQGEMLPFKKGIFVLALESGVPIIPVAIENSWRAVPTGTFAVRPTTIRMKLGKPILTTGRGTEARNELALEVHAAISQMRRELGGGLSGSEAPIAQHSEMPESARTQAR